MKYITQPRLFFSALAVSTLFLAVSCGDDDSGPLKVNADKILWYSTYDDVPEGGTSVFDPTEAFLADYDVTVQNDEQLIAAPTGYDVLVLADNFSGGFDLSDFQGSVIVTFDSGVEGVMKDFFGGNDENSYHKGKYWAYNTGSTLTWVKPSLDAEECTSGDALIYRDSLENDFSWVVRRGGLVQAYSYEIEEEASEADMNSDAVIIHEFKSGSDSKVKYWIQIGPLDSDYVTRACEVLDIALKKISK